MIIREYVQKWIDSDPVRYNTLHADMISARVGMTLEQYVWRTVRVAFLVGILFGILGFFFGALLSFQVSLGKGGIYNVLNVQFPVLFDIIAPTVYIQEIGRAHV